MSSPSSKTRNIVMGLFFCCKIKKNLSGYLVQYDHVPQFT